MRVIAFDTATPATVAALLDTETGLELQEREDPAPGARPGHAQRTLALIEKLLTCSGAGWEAVDRIAVGVGPGTFTGLRIGIATAQGLAASTGIPLVGVSTLAALAVPARTPAAAVVAVIDAKRSEIFVGGWAAGSDPLSGPGEIGPAVMAPEAWADAVATAAGGGSAAAAPLAVGDGAIRYRAILEEAGATIPSDGSPLHRICGIAVCRLGAAGEPSRHPGGVQPDYLRTPDATPPAR